MSRIEALPANLQGVDASDAPHHNPMFHKMEETQAACNGKLPRDEFYNSPTFENRVALDPLFTFPQPLRQEIAEEASTIIAEIQSTLGKKSVSARLLHVCNRISGLVHRHIVGMRDREASDFMEIMSSAEKRRSLQNTSAIASAAGGFGGAIMSFLGALGGPFEALKGVASLAPLATNVVRDYNQGQSVPLQEKASFTQSKVASDRQIIQTLRDFLERLKQVEMEASRGEKEMAQTTFRQ